MIIVDKQGLSSKVVKQGLSSMAFQVKSESTHFARNVIICRLKHCLSMTFKSKSEFCVISLCHCRLAFQACFGYMLHVGGTNHRTRGAYKV